MKLKLLVAFSIMLLLICCSTDKEDSIADVQKEETELVSSFSKGDFERNLTNVSNFVSLSTRSLNFDEENAQQVILPFVKDGEYIQKQLLEDETLSLEQRDSLENLSNEDLAILSVVTYSIVEAGNEQISTRAGYNKKLHCIGEAMAGGASVSGGFTLAFLKTVGMRTAVRLAMSSLGGMVGGAIAVAMFLNDYYYCMNH